MVDIAFTLYEEARIKSSTSSALGLLPGSVDAHIDGRELHVCSRPPIHRYKTLEVLEED